MSLKFITSGESHGKEITAIITGMPAGVFIDKDKIDAELKRRQHGYGRGGRMKIENDRVEITSGLNKDNFTTGAPITMKVANKDWENWKNKTEEKLTCPRPGHADLYGSLKYDFDNIRDVIERSSARETAARVAAGSVFKQFLEKFHVKFYSFVTGVAGSQRFYSPEDITEKEYEYVESSECRVILDQDNKTIKDIVDKVQEEKDSLGGTLRVIIKKVIPGIGSYVHYDRKLDGNISQGIMSIQSVKGIIVGNPIYAFMTGKASHDEIEFKDGKYSHTTNNSGGITGGMSTGENIYFDVFAKPIPTLMSALNTVDIKTKECQEAIKERSDVWALPALGVVCESMSAYVIAKEYLSKFGGDCMTDIIKSFEDYKERVFNS